MKKFLADLFKNVGNDAWDLARILSALSVISVMAMGGYKIYAGQQLSLSEYANGLMTVMAGCAIFIGAKDVARAHAQSKGAADT